MKECAGCKNLFPLDSFHKDSASVDGRVRKCKSCVSERSKRRYVLNRDTIRAEVKERYRANHDAIRARVSKRYSENPATRKRAMDYNRAHPEMVRAAHKGWRKRNPERDNERKRAWERAHPESKKLNLARYRALLKSATLCTIRRVDLVARISVFGGMCAYCGVPWEHLDHVKPISRRGPHCLANLRPACASCNRHKLNRHPKEWLASLNRVVVPLPLP